MAELSKDAPAVNFYTVLSCLELVTDCYFEEYKIPAGDNSDLLSGALSSTQIKALSRDIRANLRLMKRLFRSKNSYGSFKLSSVKFYNWHKIIISNHLENTFHEINKNQKYFTIGMQHLIDSYYHLNTRFLIEDQKMKCKWCKQDLSISWTEMLSLLAFEKLPNSFVYLQLAQEDENLEVPDKALNQYQNLLKELFSQKLINTKKRVEVSSA